MMPMEFLFFDKRVRICNKHKNTRRFAPGKVSKNEVKVKAGCLCSRKNSENIQKVKKILLKIEQYCCRSPRGERGLKSLKGVGAQAPLSRSPRGECGLKIDINWCKGRL